MVISDTAHPESPQVIFPEYTLVYAPKSVKGLDDLFREEDAAMKIVFTSDGQTYHAYVRDRTPSSDVYVTQEHYTVSEGEIKVSRSAVPLEAEPALKGILNAKGLSGRIAYYTGTYIQYNESV